MFENVLIEKQVSEHHRTKAILQKIKYKNLISIDDMEEIFNKVKKPYLHKRSKLNLFIAAKKGTLVKKAPAAYGLSGDPHYYFIHAYNCFYECDYCYLQGHFHTPDLAFFINHEDIAEEMEKIIVNTPGAGDPWFHAGEFSDSLGLSHLSGELPFYFDFFKNHPSAKLELRTKSANIRELLQLSPLKNVITSFSLGTERQLKIHDLKTPPLPARLNAISKLFAKDFPIAIHIDPIIYHDNLIEDMERLISQLEISIPIQKIEYISLGVVRFTKDVFYQVKQNYPHSPLLAADFVKSFDNKIRYNRPMRLWILQKIKSLFVRAGAHSQKVYLCMEDKN